MTVKRVLSNYGIYPPDAPHRGGDWHQFIEAYKSITTTCDFATYEMSQANGDMQRAHILFFENLGSREVWCGGIAVNPDAQWMAQVTRNQTDCFSGKLIAPWPQPTHGEIRCFSRLGGLLKSYRRVA